MGGGGDGGRGGVGAATAAARRATCACCGRRGAPRAGPARRASRRGDACNWPAVLLTSLPVGLASSAHPQWFAFATSRRRAPWAKRLPRVVSTDGGRGGAARPPAGGGPAERRQARTGPWRARAAWTASRVGPVQGACAACRPGAAPRSRGRQGTIGRGGCPELRAGVSRAAPKLRNCGQGIDPSRRQAPAPTGAAVGASHWHRSGPCVEKYGWEAAGRKAARRPRRRLKKLPVGADPSEPPFCSSRAPQRLLCVAVLVAVACCAPYVRAARAHRGATRPEAARARTRTSTQGTRFIDTHTGHSQRPHRICAAQQALSRASRLAGLPPFPPLTSRTPNPRITLPSLSPSPVVPLGAVATS